MFSSNSDQPDRAFEFLERNLVCSARATANFQLFLRQHEKGATVEALAALTDSLEKFQGGLKELSDNPLDAKFQRKIRWFLKKSYAWLGTISSEKLSPESQSVSPTLFHHYVIYGDLLIELKKILNFLVSQCSRTQLKHLDWQLLKEIDPLSDRGLAFYNLWDKKRTIMMLMGILCLLFIGSFHYLWVPRTIDGFLVPHPNREFSTPRPADPFISTRAAVFFKVIEKNAFQKIILRLPQALNIDRISIVLDSRPGSIVQVGKIQFLGSEGSLLHKFPVNPAKTHWDYHNLQLMEGYHITPDGLASLQALEVNKNLQKLNELLGYEQSIEFDHTLVKPLRVLEGQSFMGKAAFNEALKTIHPTPDWKQRGIIRKIFEVPTFRKLDFSGKTVLVFPPVHVNHVQQIEIDLQLSLPFAFVPSSL